MSLLSMYLRMLCLIAIIAVISSTTSNEELVSGSNQFGFDLTDELYEDAATNLWISSFCITSCFALIYAGSNGNTQSEIAETLGYPSSTASSEVTQGFLALQSSIESTYSGVHLIDEWYDSVNGVTHSEIQRISSIIGIANKIYSAPDLALKQSYIDALSYANEAFIEYDFDFTSSDAKDVINDWVSINTKGLIDSIIDEATDIKDWQLVALNAIYLNGTFVNQFDKYMTSSSTFYSDESRQSEVTDIHLMHQIDYFEYYNNGDYQFLKFEFDDWNADLFVLFVLPINNALYSINNALITDYELITDAITNLQSTRIALALPKISIELKYELNEALKNLGMVDAFDPITADFSGMSDIGLVIDKVIHKTMIEMDENGLVAAAVTAIGMVLTSIQIYPDPILFKADHPFQIFIIDGTHSNNILFMGQINDPGIIQNGDEATYDETNDDTWSDYDSYRAEVAPGTTVSGQASQTEDVTNSATSTTAIHMSQPHDFAFTLSLYCVFCVIVMNFVLN